VAKIKRSEAAAQADKPTESSLPLDGASLGEEAVAPEESPRDTIISRLVLALTLVSLVAVGLVIALVILVAKPAGLATNPIANPGNAGVTTQPAPTTSTPPAPLYLKNYIAVHPGTPKAGAIVVDIHSDYQCPWCARAEQIYGDALYQLAQSGDIDLRIHIRTLVGDQIIHNDSSERAGRAAACANQVGAFWAYHSTIFANQPKEGVGFTDDQLRVTFPAQAGITGKNLTTFQTCYDTSATTAQVSAMEQEGATAGINATPTFYVNGIQIGFDLQANGGTPQPASADQLLTALKGVA